MMLPAAVIGATVAAGGIVMLRRVIAIVTVSGASMAPTLASGDRLLVVRAPYRRVRNGRIVIIANPLAGHNGSAQHSWLVKRVIAEAGDQVPVDRVPILAGTGDPVVPDGRLVLLGDSTLASVDSREFGYVNAADLLGVVTGVRHRSPSWRRSGHVDAMRVAGSYTVRADRGHLDDDLRALGHILWPGCR
jgi:signal peptidase I